jgi:hypothetical protein
MEDLNFTHVLAGRPLPAPWRDAVAEVLADGGPGHLFRMPSGTEVSLRRLLVDMVEE